MRVDFCELVLLLLAIAENENVVERDFTWKAFLSEIIKTEYALIWMKRLVKNLERKHYPLQMMGRKCEFRKILKIQP